MTTTNIEVQQNAFEQTIKKYLVQFANQQLCDGVAVRDALLDLLLLASDYNDYPGVN